MSEIPIARLQLRFANTGGAAARPHTLRGALSQLFPHEELLHQHGQNGLIYRYPLVHYRHQKDTSVLIGFHEGAHLLSRLPLLNQSLLIGDTLVAVEEVEIRFTSEKVGAAQRLRRYFFVTPWIPFNQENYDSYKKMTGVEQMYERDRMAVANILMALRGLQVEFDQRLFAAFQLKRTVSCRYKDQKLLGLLGTLVTNVAMPDDLAIGRAVSHGYGWLKKIGA